MPYYVKVTPKVRAQILPDYTVKTRSKDGNYLLFQSDLIGIKGNTLQERADNVGGALLTPDECKAERLGTVETPAKCYTPAEYGGADEKEASTEGGASLDGPPTETPSENAPAEGTQDVVIPSVIVDNQTEANSEEESAKETSSEENSEQKTDTDKKRNNQKESEVNNE